MISRRVFLLAAAGAPLGACNTAQMAGRPLHVVPAALLVWMIALYRHPAAAGALLGVSIGVIYYPVFLIPLWASFYSRRGGLRFGAGLACTLAAIAGSVALFMPDRLGMFWEHYKDMFNPWRGAGEGLWLHWQPYARLPVTVLWSDFTTGKPDASPKATDIVGIRWVLPTPAGAGTATPTTYPVDITVDNIALIPQ